jgi:hypothetical protein
VLASSHVTRRVARANSLSNRADAVEHAGPYNNDGSGGKRVEGERVGATSAGCSLRRTRPRPNRRQADAGGVSKTPSNICLSSEQTGSHVDS